MRIHVYCGGVQIKSLCKQKNGDFYTCIMAIRVSDFRSGSEIFLKLYSEEIGFTDFDLEDITTEPTIHSHHDDDHHPDYVYHDEGSGDDHHHDHPNAEDHEPDHHHEHHHHHEENPIKVQFPELDPEHLGLEATRSDLSESEKSFVDLVGLSSS